MRARSRRKGGSRSIDFRKWASRDDRELFLACVYAPGVDGPSMFVRGKERKIAFLDFIHVKLYQTSRCNSRNNDLFLRTMMYSAAASLY